jgi:hypothetical protein
MESSMRLTADIRGLILVLALAALAACAPPEPFEEVGGVGFGSPADFRAQREAELRNGPQPGFGVPVAGAGAPVTQLPTGPGAPLPPEIYAAVAAAEAGTPPLGGAPLNGTLATVPVTDPSVGVAAVDPTAVPVLDPNNTGISDENEFDAVASRETIETDKARIEANKAQYVEIAPTALPERSGNSASPIIEYAINAQNRLGQKVYDRSGLALADHDKACLRYASPAEAQEAFLNSGGPRRDSRNLDPDGDGFACKWDPTPFQKARG